MGKLPVRGIQPRIKGKIVGKRGVGKRGFEAEHSPGGILNPDEGFF